MEFCYVLFLFLSSLPPCSASGAYKGQTKSKWFFQVDVSSKKRTNEFNFTTMGLVFVCLLEKIGEGHQKYISKLTDLYLATSKILGDFFQNYMNFRQICLVEFSFKFFDKSSNKRNFLEIINLYRLPCAHRTSAGTTASEFLLYRLQVDCLAGSYKNNWFYFLFRWVLSHRTSHQGLNSPKRFTYLLSGSMSLILN